MTRLLMIALVLVTAVAGVLAAPTARAAKSDDPNEPGYLSLASCTQQGRSLSVLIVLDRSGSLAGTDPNGVRYAGLEAGLEALARMAQRADEDFDVDVAVSAFSDDYTSRKRVVDWIGLGTENEEDRRKLIDGIVRKAEASTTPNGGTNFSAALRGGLKDLEDRAGAGNCRVLLWFTDGLDPNVGEICSPDGLADRYREQGIPLIALHLTNADQAAGAGDLPRIAYGSDSGRTCGTHPLPEGWAPGMYLDASDPSQLPTIFNTIGLIAQGCTSTGPRGWVIEPGIRRATLSFGSGSPVTFVRLTGPGGIDITAPSEGTFTQGGYTTDSFHKDGYVEMTLVPPPGQGIGTWTVTPDVPVRKEAISWCVYADASLELDPTDADSLGGGQESSLKIAVVDPTGAPVDLAAYSAVAPTITAVDSAGQPLLVTAEIADPAQGLLVATVTPGMTDPRIELTAMLALTTASGLDLPAVQATWPLPVALSKDFPVVAPADELVLSPAVRTEPARGEFRLIGSPEGATQVCFQAPENLIVPERVTTGVLEYEQGCIDLAAGESRVVPVTFTPTESAVGAASADIPVSLIAAQRGGKRASAEMVIPARWRLTTPFDAPLLWLVLIAAIAVSVLLPLLAMALANWVTARFDVTGVAHSAIPVTIRDGEPVRSDPIPGQPRLLVDPAELMPTHIQGARKSHAPGLWGRLMSRGFTLADLTFSVEDAAHPLKRPVFLVAVPAGKRVITADGQFTPQPKRRLPWRRRDEAAPGTVGRTRPGFAFFWAFVVPDSELRSDGAQAWTPGSEQAAGTLHVLVSMSGAPEQALMDDLIRSGVPWTSRLDRLRDEAEVQEATESAAPGLGAVTWGTDAGPEDPPESEAPGQQKWF